MSNATLERIRKASAANNIASKTSGNPDELTDINFELMPIEILTAAAKELGDKALPQYVCAIYEFGISAQLANAQVKKTQLGGLVLTHKKLTDWLASKSAKSFIDLNNKEVLKAYLRFHQQRIEESLEALQVITEEITK